MIYLIVFFISTFFVYISEKNFKNNRRKRAMLFSIIAILLPSLLAAFRAEGVGTDTLYYAKNNFQVALNSSTFEQFNRTFELELLYNILVYVISRITDNIHVLYFAIQTIIMTFVYRACYDQKDNCPMWLSFLLFLLLYYNRSLNMIRQSIALSIILFSYKYIKEKNLKKYILFVIIASLFHKTALLSLIIYFMVRLIEKKESFLYKIFIFLISFLFLIGYQEIMFLLIELGIIPSKYLFYVTSSESNILLIELIRKIIFLGIFILFGKSLKRNNEKNHILKYFMSLDLILYLVGIYANYAQRIAYYLGYFDIFLIAQLPNCCRKGLSRKGMYILIIIFFIIYWFIYYAILQYDSTYPYISIFE